MNAYELADKLDEYNKDGMPVLVVEQAAAMLRKQADRIKLLQDDGMVLIQLIADLGEEKKKLRLQKAYLIDLENALETSIKLNKAQAERKT